MPKRSDGSSKSSFIHKLKFENLLTYRQNGEKEIPMGKKKIYTPETFSYDKAKVGDRVTADVVMIAMNALPPITMRSDCAQLGEPHSHRLVKGRSHPTFATFRCIKGDFNEGEWEFCGYCFAGESKERP